MPRNTVISIVGDAFHVNGEPTYAGRTFRGMPVEGLLLNARLVQGIFDDLNPETRGLWDYPDGPWDPDRNTEGFVDAMPKWHRHGLLAFTLNLQGGNPRGYGSPQPWHNSAFTADGRLRDDYLGRLTRILDRADELGMVVILGYFYFGQDERLEDEAAVIRAADQVTDWLLDRAYTHVIVEIGNESDHVAYEHAILRPPRVADLIRHVQLRCDRQLLVGTSLCGSAIPHPGIVATSDFLLLHGNGVAEPDRIRTMVDTVRAMPAYRGQPIVVNEDDHFDFDQPDNNFLAAVSRHASWGLFDYRLDGAGFNDGYQSVPTNWGISSDRKRGFFNLLAEMTGGGPNRKGIVE